MSAPFYKIGKLNVIIDGQWGSTGKGKIAGYLALRESVDIVVCDFMTNAGHVFVNDYGEETMLQQLPMTCLNKDCVVMIGPTANITVDVLLQELERVPGVAKRLMIHPHAGVIAARHAARERQDLECISSTCKGCGAATADKIMRKLSLAKDDPRLKQFLGDTVNSMHSTLRSGGTAVMEAAQGFGLSLNFGQYPYTTSRDVTTMTAMNTAGVGPRQIGNVLGCLRTYPIRVGNVIKDGKRVGFSGPTWDEGVQHELSWEEITQRSGSPVSLQEKTTVTKKVRRVFEFNFNQFSDFLRVCEPTHFFVNFANYLNTRDYGISSWHQLSKTTKDWMRTLNRYAVDEYCGADFTEAPSVAFIGTGPQDSEMVRV